MATQPDAGHLLVLLAAQTISRVLRQIDANLSFALCGEAASSIYRGSGGAPPLEVMILSPSTMLEPLTHAIVLADPVHFFSISGSGSLGFLCGDTLAFYESPRHIPVDITVSPKSPPPGHISDIGGIPLVPYYHLILQKLEKWDISAHQEQQGHIPRGSSSNLSKEIRAMLYLFRLRKLHSSQPPFDVQLHTSSEARVIRFSAIYQSFRKEWKKMGFLKQTNAPVQATHRQQTPKKPKSAAAASDKLAAGPSSISAHNQNIPSASSGESKGESVQQNNVPASVSMGIETTAQGHAGASKETVAAAKKQKSAKGPRIPFTRIRQMAAHATVEVLHDLGCACAIFGSFACKLYGNNRIPNDVDILVLPPPQSTLTQEDIKEAIAAADPDRFVLKAARDPTATYRVLYYCVSTSTAPSSSSKVDILLPGVMHLPALPTSLITWKNELPLVPFSVLILQKLQGWDDHRNAAEDRYTKKAPVDAQDLAYLIGGNGRNRAVLREVKQTTPWSNRILFSEEFERLSRERVISFCEEFPQQVRVFKNLGFATA